MSDFEKRLGEALSAGAEEAPGSTVGLAAGARRRSRARRRTTVAGVAAAVALAVAVPVSIVGLGGSDSSAPVADRVTDPNVGEVADTKTTRTETWRNVTLEVPADWEYGGVTAWCADGRTLDEPVVQRPGIAVQAVGCSPSSGYGVTLGSLSLTDRGGVSGEVSQPDDEYAPEGAWFGFVTSPAGDVTVTAPDEATARSVLGSLTVLDDDERDPNGCTPKNPDDGGVLASEQMSVCRYTPDGWLEQSERLSEADTVTAVTALNAAPDGDAPLPLSFCPSKPDEPGTVITMRSPDYAAEVVLEKPCTLSTSFRSEDDGYRKLTKDVMFWALSPGWSGSLAPGVPKPESLRSLVDARLAVRRASTADNPRVQCDSPVNFPSGLNINGEPLSGLNPSWLVSAMDGTLTTSFADAEIRTVFADVLERQPSGAPMELQEAGAEEAEWLVLSDEGDLVPGDRDLVLGLGEWSTADGPGSQAGYLTLERTDAGLRPTGWGVCRGLRTVVPEGRNPVTVVGARASGDGRKVVLTIKERGCTKQRDARPYLGAPEIVQSEEGVSVFLTSESPTPTTGPVGTCDQNPPVSITVQLDQPIGDRELADAGVWPRKPIRVLRLDTGVE